jgi:hypothetical protein
MVDGGLINRKCSKCMGDIETQRFYACGYIPEEERRPVVAYPKGVNDSTMVLTKCPVWYYNENISLYKWCNMAQKSNISIMDLPLGKRIVLTEFNKYINLLIEKERKKANNKGKNGTSNR